MKIYIAGPYTATTDTERLANVTRAIDAGLVVWQRGHVPYIPHLTHYIDARVQERGLPIGYEEYMAYDDAWLACCEGFLYLAPSPGADRELQRAQARGMVIFYHVEEVLTSQVYDVERTAQQACPAEARQEAQHAPLTDVPEIILLRREGR